MYSQHRTEAGTPTPNHAKLFICHEESNFYATCLQSLVLRDTSVRTVIEFGSGNGVPVLQALQGVSFRGRITGFEINRTAAEAAAVNIRKAGVMDQYQVRNTCFFKAAPITDHNISLAANPPWIPVPDARGLLLPELWGGRDGSDIMCRLLEQQAFQVMLLVPSIANPLKVVQHALDLGYHVHAYLVTCLPFGVYTSRNHVFSWLHHMRDKGTAFFFSDHYLLAGILFRATATVGPDIRKSLLHILTCTEKDTEPQCSNRKTFCQG